MSLSITVPLIYFPFLKKQVSFRFIRKNTRLFVGAKSSHLHRLNVSSGEITLDSWFLDICFKINSAMKVRYFEIAREYGVIPSRLADSRSIPDSTTKLSNLSPASILSS